MKNIIITQYSELGKLTLPELLEVKLCNITIFKYLRIKYQETFLLWSFVCLGDGIPGGGQRGKEKKTQTH